MSKGLREKFMELMSHLNSEENEMGQEFAVMLDKHIEDAQDDSLWRSCLENGGVDNWHGHYDSLKEGGYYGDEEEEDDE